MKNSIVIWSLVILCLAACYSSPPPGTASSNWREVVPFKSDTILEFDRMDVYLGEENLGKIILDSSGKYYLDVTNLKNTKDHIRQYGCVGKFRGKNIVQFYDNREAVIPIAPEQKIYYFARSLYPGEKMNRHHPYSRYNSIVDSLEVVDTDSLSRWMKKQADSMASK